MQIVLSFFYILISFNLLIADVEDYSFTSSNTTLTTDRLSCHWLDSNQESQEPTGRTSTSFITRPRGYPKFFFIILFYSILFYSTPILFYSIML